MRKSTVYFIGGILFIILGSQKPGFFLDFPSNLLDALLFMWAGLLFGRGLSER